MRQAPGTDGTASFRGLLGAALFLAAARLSGQSIDRAVELHQNGQLQEALRAYREVISATLRTDSATAAAALNNVCVLQQDLGDFRAALPDCEEALRLRRAIGDSFAVAETLNNLGLTLEALGRTGEAERHYREALGLNRQLGEAASEAINLGNLATLALQAGRYSEAMRLYTEAGDLAIRHRTAPWAAEQSLIARINQGVVLERVGAYREALDLYRSLLSGSDGLDPRRRAALLVNTGVLYRNLGDPVSAAEAFREAIASYRTLRDTAGLSNAHLNLGLALHLNLERSRDAEVSYREALRLAEESGDRTEEILDLFYLGRLLLGQGRLPEAEAVFRRCLAASAESGSPEGRWSAGEGLGRIAAARGDLPGALTHFLRALDEIEQVRAGIERSGWRAGYFGDKRSVYAAAVDVLWRLEQSRSGQGFAGQALEVVQRAKARDLLDALQTNSSPLSRRTGGRWERGVRGVRGPATAAEIMGQAGDNTLLEYFLGEDRLYLWTIHRAGVRMTDLGPRKPILDDVLRIHRDLAQGAEPEPAAVARLSRALLGSAGRLPQRGEQLHIAPDGLLHYLPFEILEPPGAPGLPLVEQAVVSYVPSVSVIHREARERKQPAAPLRLAGFGAPRIPRSPGLFALPRLEPVPLPAAQRELATIGDLLGGRSEAFTGETATERSFRETFARGARVVHFATHTVVDERLGGGAAILLTAEGEDDGLLFPREIANLDGRSDLAVLAACRTALGAGEEDGRALSSLTGSFLAAGAPAVVATLWDVGDTATAAFMEQLYTQLGRGLPPDEALRQAKLRLRADPRWNRPALWAGYVLVGEAPPVAPRRWVWWAVGAVGLLVLTSIAVLARRSRRASQPLHPGSNSLRNAGSGSHNVSG